MYDIAIIGAGPAGATLARLIGNKYKVILIDKRQLDKEPEGVLPVKSCGGLVAPDAQKVLAQMELGLPKNVLAGPQLFTVRTIDLQCKEERYYQRYYINIDREKFDRWLVSMIPSSVETRYGCQFKSYRELEGQYEIVLSKDGKQKKEIAKVIVGADGAYSLIRRQLYPECRFEKMYISTQEWFEQEEVQPYFSALFDKEITDFYCWTIPKDKHLIVGAALEPGEKANARFELLKTKLVDYGFKLGNSVRREGAFILRPVSPTQIKLGLGRIILIGEAAGWISPSSAEGLSYAFRSALALAKSLEDRKQNILRSYYDNTLPIRVNISIKNLKAPFMYNAWLRKIIMGTGLEAININK